VVRCYVGRDKIKNCTAGGKPVVRIKQAAFETLFARFIRYLYIIPVIERPHESRRKAGAMSSETRF
jgi:hypothetical protein